MYQHGAQCSFHVHNSINVSSICQFLDIDVQEISGKHPENSGNLLSQTGLFPGNLHSQTGFYFQEISLSERLWSGERITGHGNFLSIFLQCMYVAARGGLLWCEPFFQNALRTKYEIFHPLVFLSFPRLIAEQ
jgi:hypothetical protein